MWPRFGVVLTCLAAGALTLPAGAGAMAGWVPAASATDVGATITGLTGAARPDGVMVMAWQEQTGSAAYSIRVAQRQTDGTYTRPDTLDTQSVPFTGLAVAADSASNAIVTWCSGPLCTHVSNLSQLKYVRYDIGGAHSSPATIAANGFDPSLAIDDSGHAYVAYSTDGGGVHVASFSSDAPSTPEITDVAQAYVAHPLPQIAVGDGGGPTLLYLDTTPDPGGAPNLLRSLRSAPDADWTGATAQVLDAEPSGVAISDVRLTTDSAGRALAAWVADGNSFSPGPPPSATGAATLKTAFAGPNGAPFGTAGTSRTAGSGAFSAPAVAIDSSGVGHVAYTRAIDSGGSMVLTGSASGSDTSFGTAQAGGPPSLAALRDGSLLLSARQDDHINAVRIASDGQSSSMTLDTQDVLADPLAVTAPGNDAAVLWIGGPTGADERPRVAGYDATAPKGKLGLPGDAVAGQPVTLAINTMEMWSQPQLDWNFGDGTTGATTRSVRHIYATAGSYPVSVTVTDSHDQQSVVSGTITVAPAAPPAGGGNGDGGNPGGGDGGSNDGGDSGGDKTGGDAGGKIDGSGDKSGDKTGGGTGDKSGGKTGGGSGGGTTGSGAGGPKRAFAQLFPIGRLVIRGSTVKAAYGIICAQDGLPCTVRGIVRNGPRKIGTFTLHIRPGRSARVTFKLTKAGQRRLLRYKKLKVRMSAAGVKGLPISFTLRAPRKKRAKVAWF